MIVSVDNEKCIGCGLCVNMSSELFQMQEDKAQAVVDVVPSELEETAADIKKSCPVDAIILN